MSGLKNQACSCLHRVITMNTMTTESVAVTAYRQFKIWIPWSDCWDRQRLTTTHCSGEFIQHSLCNVRMLASVHKGTCSFFASPYVAEGIMCYCPTLAYPSTSQSTFSTREHILYIINMYIYRYVYVDVLVS